MAKKYRIISGFYYHGADGKTKKGVLIGPGEKVPKLDSLELERFLREERICEVGGDGENIIYKKLRSLSDDQIHGLISKGPNRVMQEIKSGLMYSNETWAKVYREAERSKMPQATLDAIEHKFINK